MPNISTLNINGTSYTIKDTTARDQISDEINARTNAINSETTARTAGLAQVQSTLQSQIDQLVSPSGEAPSAAEVENARVGADGLTYSTLGDAIREQNTDITDVINGSGVEHMYFNTSDTSRFTQTTNASSIWMKNRIFKKGYVEYIQFHRNAAITDTANQRIKIWFCDTDRKVIKTLMVWDGAKDPIVNVGSYIDCDFLLAFCCYGQYFGSVDTGHPSLRCSGWIWTDYYYRRIDDTFPELTVNDTINFNIDVAYTSLVDRIDSVDSKTRGKYSISAFKPWYYTSDNASDANTLGDGIYGIRQLFPAGYIESISLLYNSKKTDQIGIWIINENSLILKKVFDSARNRLGILDVQIDYYSDEPFYVFVRAPGIAWADGSNSEAYRDRWFGAWGTYGYNVEGEYLCGSSSIPWQNHDTVWLAYTVNYDSSVIKTRGSVKGGRLYTLEDAYKSWAFDANAKFPIVVLGDSTTDADTTTGATGNVIGTDHQDPNSYTTILQAYLREALGNTALRIYNAGFSGKSATWALTNIDSIVWNNSYYSDSKIMIISHGINDYVTNENAYNAYRYALRQIILECFKHNVQPVMMTTQAGTENYGRFGWKQMSLADKLAKEVAEEYNLEVIDKNAYTAFFNVYSSYRMNQIIPDGCHYSDVGHKFVAGLMFKELVPFTVVAGDGTTILSFADERLRTDLEFSSFSGYIWKDVKVITPANGFKLEASCSKTASVKMMDYWVFVYAKNKKRLVSYCTTPNVQTVVVDGVSYNVTSSEQEISTLDLGLHHIVVNSSANENVNYLGLKLVD